MTNLHKKLNTEAEHIRLTPAEKSAMRAAIFGAPAPVASPMRVVPSQYVFLSSTWMRAFAAVLIVAFVGTGTAFASEGSLPGQPLYGIKTNVIEPMQVALASTPSAKAAVHVQIAAARVAEAETLAEHGALDATTSAQLAANYEENAARAVALADEASTTDPSATAEVRAQLAVNSTVGSAVLVALADRSHDRSHADAFAARVLAVATSGHGGQGSDNPMRPAAASVRTMAAVSPQATEPAGGARTFAAFSASTSSDTSGTEQSSGERVAATAPAEAKVAALNPQQEKTAAGLQLKAQAAITALRAQFAAASSTLNATTTVSIETQLSGIDSLMQAGATALNDSLFDTAVNDFAQAFARSLRLSALLVAQQKFDNHLIDPLIKDNSQNGGGDSGDSDHAGGSVVHDILQSL